MVLKYSQGTLQWETKEILGETDIVLLTFWPKNSLINKSGNKFAVFDIYLPFVGVFNLMVRFCNEIS